MSIQDKNISLPSTDPTVDEDAETNNNNTVIGVVCSFAAVLGLLLVLRFFWWGTANDGQATAFDPANNDDEEKENGVASTDTLPAVDDEALETSPPGVGEAAEIPGERKKARRQLEATKRAAALMFPTFAGAVRSNLDNTPQGIKDRLFDFVDSNYQAISEEDKGRLLKCENGAELCKALGMNNAVVDMKFQALAKLESELGFTGKTPFLHSVYDLIETIDVANPFGAVNLKITDNYNGEEWLSYLGVEMKEGFMHATIKNVYDALEKRDYKDCFMHGTIGKVLGLIVDADNTVIPSPVTNTIRQDFGSGLYCVKGHLERVMSVAFDRCWPWLDQTGELIPNRDNPAVILFPQNLPDKAKVYEVSSKSPFKNKELMRRLSKKKKTEKKILESMKDWKEEDKNWKEFVKIARYAMLVPEGYDVFHGWLHDCYATMETDKCAEPELDKDLWEQYCFPDPEILGEKKLFIEFFIDWSDWLASDMDDAGITIAAKRKLDQIKKCEEDRTKEEGSSSLRMSSKTFFLALGINFFNQ